MRYDLEIDKQKGFELFNEAVDKGNINVLNYQKSIYENEELIVKDLNEINYWYQRSAENDNKIALYKQFSYSLCQLWNKQTGKDGFAILQL
ncbi:hypothetical protein RclHR1_25820002 [Rhizophagus clarus]|uniref:Uncharacterized protein n=1 Tax=Rhizophagus clarus TaxID=94130 RepID=A0A2Z6QZP8_9GLOM|nr:hypothetical protein RclHR1_25820002 [Rhizophagus clarus]